MELLNSKLVNKIEYPVKVLQFGEGNFLRGFVDWMINKANNKDQFKGSVRIVQPLENGLVNLLNNQDGLYTLISQGLQKGEVVREKEIISCIEKGVNPYTDYNNYIESAKIPELRFIISNTTEAGIAYNPGEKLTDAPQISYPGKLTSFLYKRYLHFSGDPSKGLIIIPCELIDRNGDNLKKIVYQLALEWNLEQEFINWLDSSNFFLNSLVDRIVTGYPKDDIENLTNELQYKDNLINTCEVFNLWVIEGDSKLSNELPLANTGCNVIWTNDMTPYRTRKVRILNGVHTMMCMTSYLYGLDTVGNSLKDPIISKYIKKGLYDEIIPSVNFNEDELKSFASDVLERFANPFIEHQLMSITLNSVSKYKARVLPTMLEYVSKFNSAPKTLSCGLASLIHFYKGINEKGEIITVSDDKDILIKFRDLWDKFDANLLDSQSLVSSILSDISFWGEDLTKNRILTNGILFYFNSIQDKGIGQTLKELV